MPLSFSLRRSLISSWALLFLLGLGAGCSTGPNRTDDDDSGDDDDSVADDDDGQGDDDDTSPDDPFYRPPAVTQCGGDLPQPTGGELCTATEGGSGLLLQGVVLTPDEVLVGGSVLLDTDGWIQCVGCDCAAGDATVVSCPEGLVSPGLINAHDHITFSQNAPIPHGDERYEHRHDWRKGQNGHTKLSASGSASNSEKQWYELRMVLSGATSVFGSGDSDGLLRNVDRDDMGLGAGDVKYETFPLGDSGGERRIGDCYYPDVDSESVLVNNDAYVPHVAEGIGLDARNELICVTGDQYDGGVDLAESNASYIHAVGIDASDAALLSAEGTGVIWSPRSNISLYGETAPVTLLADLGVDIGLGTDWTPSGSMNMLRELACAAHLNRTYYGGYFGDWQLWHMATRGSARTLHIDDLTGELAVAHAGDIAVFDGRDGGIDAPFTAIVDADPGDVALVLRGGEVLYGDSGLVPTVAAAQGRSCESMGDVCGAGRHVCLQDEIGTSWSSLEGSNSNNYDLFACGVPPQEPSCEPFRSGEFDGTDTLDSDGDGVDDTEDNCPSIFNPVRPMDLIGQADHDFDGLGDVCDPCPLDADTEVCGDLDPDDRDADGVADGADNCLMQVNPSQTDSDSDGMGDACDPCPLDENGPGGSCPASVYDIKQRLLPTDTRVELADLIVTARAGSAFFMQIPAENRDATLGADYSGLFAWIPDSNPDGVTIPEVGDRISFTADIGEYHNQVQVDFIDDMTVLSSGNAAPEPVVATAAEMGPGGTRAGALDGVVVTVDDAVITDVDTEAGDFEVDSALWTGSYLHELTVVAMVDDVIDLSGVLRGDDGDSRIQPRSDTDFVLVTGAPPEVTGFSDTVGFLYDGDIDTQPLVDLVATFHRPAPAGGFEVSLSSADTAIVTVPATLTLAEGETELPLVASAVAVGGPVTITLDDGTGTATVDLEVLDPARAAQVSAVGPAGGVVSVGTATTLTVWLDVPAGAGGVRSSWWAIPAPTSTSPTPWTSPRVSARLTST